MAKLYCLVNQLENGGNPPRRAPIKINSRTNREGYDGSETAVGKLLARRIQICRVYFCKTIVGGARNAKISPKNITKIDTADLNAPC